jgi:competence protein ComFA
MGPPKYIVYYLTSGDRIRIGLSPDPALDGHFWQSQGYCPPKPLSLPLPLFEAEQFLFSLTDKPFAERRTTVLGRLRLLWHARKLRFAKHPFPQLPPSMLPALKGHSELAQLLAGRIYLWQELESLWQGEALPLHLQRLLLEGKCHTASAVGLDRWGRLVCRRCGSSKVEATPWCCKGKICFHCQECSSLGRSSTCSSIVAMPRRGNDEPRKIEIKLSFALTRAQIRASRQLVEFVEDKHKKTCLLWAVCGAGKTEVSYQAARSVLAAGGRVLFAIPRRSVVRELAERMKKAFRGVAIQVLYGGVSQHERRQDAPLVIATTHQVMRFYRNFDLVILDEVDAFPYRGSQMLERSLERSLRKTGKRIFMTATPDRTMLKRAKESWTLVRIPVRPHGQPLPVPRLFINSSLKERPLSLPSQVWEEIEQAQSLFVFVPSVALCKAVARELAKEVPQVASCHAQDPKRDQKLLAFRQGQVRVLVATTVAERGITVPGADVMVLFANHKLFDERVLVQMAGRAGRAWQRPQGKVWFVATSHSKSMAEAIRQIKDQNAEAERLKLSVAS